MGTIKENAKKHSLVISVIGFLGIITPYIFNEIDIQRKHQQDYEVWNNNQHDKIECELDSIKIKPCKN